MWFVYILECGDGSLYVGSTSDLAKRIGRHAAGRGAAYTRSRRPIKLLYAEPVNDRLAAVRRERSIKQLSIANKRKLVLRGGGHRFPSSQQV
jgi:putative endonuclease